MSKAITTVKRAFIRQAEFVAAHPWPSLAAIWALAVLAVAF